MPLDENFPIRLSIALNGRKQTAVSKQLKCSQAAISAYLYGHTPRSLSIMAKLANEYKIDLNWLLTGKQTPQVKELVTALKPHIMAYLAGMLNEAQTARDQWCSLLETLPKSKEQLRQQQELHDRLAELERQYRDVVDELNVIFEPLEIQLTDRIPPTWKKM